MYFVLIVFCSNNINFFIYLLFFVFYSYLLKNNYTTTYIYKKRNKRINYFESKYIFYNSSTQIIMKNKTNRLFTFFF